MSTDEQKTVDVIAQVLAVGGWAEADEDERETYRIGGRAIAAALADAGLLLPPGGEVRECWRDYDTVSGGSVGFDSLAGAVEWRERYSKPLVPWDPPPHPAVTQVCSITTWPRAAAWPSRPPSSHCVTRAVR